MDLSSSPHLEIIKKAIESRTQWAAFPDTFAAYASQGKWKRFNYIRYITNKITPAIGRGNARFIITMPPRHGKSELISNWLPTWYLYNYSERKIILCSYSAEFAAKWGGIVKQNLTENPLIYKSLSKSSKSKKQFRTLEGGQMVCAGVGGPITGQGANLLIIDDPVKNWEDAKSEKVQEAHREWFKTTAMTRLDSNGSAIILLTRWHEMDLAGWILETQKNDTNAYRRKFEVINFPAICEEDNDPIGRQIGDALCPEMFPIEELLGRKATSGDMQFAALYQQRPTALAGNIIRREWFKFYSTVPSDFQEIGIFADLSYKEGPSNDFTVVEAWGIRGQEIYLLAQIRGRMGFTEQIESIKAMTKRYPSAVMKQIEEHANGAAVIEVLKREMMGITPIKPKTSKMVRLASVSPLYQAGNIIYPDPKLNPWVEENLAELLSFPNAKHDDTVDVACYAVSYFSQIHANSELLNALTKW